MMKKISFAMVTAVPAMPPNPKIAAMIATTRKAKAQLNMKFPPDYRQCLRCNAT